MQESAGASVQGQGPAGKKANKRKHKSRNDFSDVQRIELDAATGGAVPQKTTIELMKESVDLDDLSKKLDERLKVNSGPATNGNHHETTAAEVQAGNEPQNGPVDQPKSEAQALATRNRISDKDPDPVQDQGTAQSSEGAAPKVAEAPCPCSPENIEYRLYESELQMPDIIRLIQRDLSEPYSIYTYRYFIHNWPQLCFLAMHGSLCVGAIVCKVGMHGQIMKRGYIAMLAVDKEYRKLKIGTNLVQKAIEAMLKEHADEVVLETEITNTPALRLYENLGFVRDKRLFHYYLNGVDALRLKLWFR